MRHFLFLCLLFLSNVNSRGGVNRKRSESVLALIPNVKKSKQSNQNSRDGNEPGSCESSQVRVPKSEFLVGFCEFESSRAKRKSVSLN